MTTTNTPPATIQIFDNPEFGEIRTTTINNEPWFVGKDVSVVFGDTNHSRTLSRIDEEDKSTISIIDSLGRKQNAIIVNESGLYAMLFAMQPQKANKKDGVSDAYPIETQERIAKLKKFKRWVTAEVLPTIRKTGGYVNNEDAFISTYLPFADENTKLLFRTTLHTINEQNRLIAKQQEEISYQEEVITGLVEDISLADKRQILNRVMRHSGADYQDRWRALYREFDSTQHMNTKLRMERYNLSATKKVKSRLDYIDTVLNKLPELYDLAAKLYHTDVEKLIAEMYGIRKE